MKNENDKKFDLFITTNLSEPTEKPKDEWSIIFQTVSENKYFTKPKAKTSFLKYWPTAVATLFSLCFVFYNYKKYQPTAIENLIALTDSARDR